MMKSKVLHISLAHGGGIISALEGYIENSEFADHYLIAATDDSCQVNVGEKANLKKTYFIKKNLKGLFDIRRIFSEVKPTHIHLHSSIAGVVGRVMFPFFKKLIYTPHCFAFERNDVSFITKKAFYLAEVILSLKPAVIAGCSPREVELADKLSINLFNNRANNVFLTNYSNFPLRWKKPEQPKNTVIMIGRVCLQKDPEFFIETYKAVNKLDDSIHFRWVGSGDPADVNKLEANGISCSGWLSRDELLKEVMDSDLYFHCASWEGNPMSVLEICRMEMPIVGRAIEPLKSIGMNNLAETPRGCAELIVEHFNKSYITKNDYENVNRLCNIDRQKKALEIIYSC